MKFRLSLLISVLILALRAAAADSTLGVASLGWVFDASAGVIRPINGILGAATLGETLDLPPLQNTAISSAQRFALAVFAEGDVRLVRLGSGSTLVDLPGAMTSPDRILLSAGGRAAVLYQRSSGQTQLITGLPDNPQLLDTALGSAPVAVADDGTLARSDSLSSPLSTAAFRQGSTEMVGAFADGQVFLLRNGAIRELGLFPAMQAQFSKDGSHAYFISADGNLMIADLATGASQVLSCNCTPSGLESLSTPGVFQLTNLASGPMSLFDSGAEPRFWFIPALSAQRSAE